MKRILSVVIMLSFLTGLLGVFSYVPVSGADTDTMYSGGSGTKDDPYLISKSYDMYELCQNIEKDHTLWGDKKYYKLTKNISLSYRNLAYSPLYENKGFGMTCFVSAPYDTNDIAETNYGQMETLFSEITESMGYLYSHYNLFSRDLYQYMLIRFEEHTSADSLYRISCYYNETFPILDYYDYRLYRKAAFTGVFDGNGYCITADNACIFGFVENGAEIKNLKIRGKNTSLAYYVGEGCKVTDCTFDVNNGKTLTYTSAYERDYYENTDIPYAREVISTEKGVIHNNFGTVSRCINIQPLSEGIIGTNKGKLSDILSYGEISNLSSADEGIERVLNLGTTTNKKDDEIYTSAECEAANGDHRYFKGFDFENVWVMKDGYPVLRTTLENGTGDLNLDGVVNGMDTNLLKRFLAGASVSIEYTNPLAADMDKNQSLDAMDASLLKRCLAGK